MKKSLHVIFSLLMTVLFFAGAALGLGSPPPKEVTLIGTIRMVGNEPFSSLVLETANKKLYVIVGEKSKELSLKQHSRVEATGTLEKSNVPYAKEAINIKTYRIF